MISALIARSSRAFSSAELAWRGLQPCASAIVPLDRHAAQKVPDDLMAQPPQAAMIRHELAALPLSWVQGRSALTGVLLANTIVGPYCVSSTPEGY